MKLKMALAAVALTMMGATVAQAQLRVELYDVNTLEPSSTQVVSIQDDPRTGDIDSVAAALFGGTIFNDSDDLTIILTGDDVSRPAGVNVDQPLSDFDLGIFPFTLGPRESVDANYLFGIFPPDLNGYGVNPDGSLVDPVNGFFYTVFGEDENGNPVDPASAQYGVIGAGAPVVPEPGTIALLVSSLVGGSLMLRRRK
jgi:hypothetical protein